MATYGSSLYGASLYGPDTTTGLFLTTGAASPTQNYGEIQVQWVTPGGSWSRLRVVRNSYGFPTDADDGTVVLDGNFGPTATAPVDPVVNNIVDSGLNAPQFYYYSVFVLSAVGVALTWNRCVDLTGQSVADHDYPNYLVERLPAIFSNTDQEVEGQPSTASPLFLLLSLLGHDLSRLRDYLDALLLTEDPDHVHGTLLPLLLNQYGYDYEPEIGMRQNRILARNATYLWQTNGTTNGVQGFASALTGWGAAVQPLVNLCLDTDYSSFEGTGTYWSVLTNNGTWARDTTAHYSDGTTSAKITYTGSGASVVHFGIVYNGGPTAKQYGIPVAAGTSYYASAQLNTPTGGTPTQGYISLYWYDATGTFLSQSDGARSEYTTADDTAWTQASLTATAPANAVYAVPVLSWTAMANGEVQRFDAVMVALATLTSGIFVPARQVRIVLDANRINEVHNAGFDNDVNDWSTTSATLTQDTVTTYEGGIGSGKVVTSATGGGISTIVPMDAGAPVCVAAEVYPSVTGSYTLKVVWKDVNGNVLRTDSTTASLTGAEWTRMSLTGNSTPTGCDQGLLSVLNNDASATFWVDDVLVEETSTLKPYFDLRTHPGDVLFDGASGESRSYLYNNYNLKKSRLTSLLPDHLPLGTPFALSFAVPRDETYDTDIYQDVYA